MIQVIHFGGRTPKGTWQEQLRANLVDTRMRMET
jgi:hypothetical protein